MFSRCQSCLTTQKDYRFWKPWPAVFRWSSQDVVGSRKSKQTLRVDFLFEPGDAQGLARRLRSVLLDEELARTLKRNGVEGVHRHYSVGRMADRTMSLYDGLQNSRERERQSKQARSSARRNTCRGFSCSFSSSRRTFAGKPRQPPERYAFFPPFLRGISRSSTSCWRETTP